MKDTDTVEHDMLKARSRGSMSSQAAVEDLYKVAAGGVHVSLGDARCLFSGHIARLSAGQLWGEWSSEEALAIRLERATTELSALADRYDSRNATMRLINLVKTDKRDQLELFGPEEVAGAAPV